MLAEGCSSNQILKIFPIGVIPDFFQPRPFVTIFVDQAAFDPAAHIILFGNKLGLFLR